MKLLFALILASIMSVELSEPSKSGSEQSQKPIFSFGIITDVQYCNCEPEESRFYRNSVSKLRFALNTLRKDSAEFLINLGDLIDRDYSSFKTVLDIIDSSGFKTYHCAGNHDYSVENRFKRRLPIPFPSKDGYYSFVYKNFRFIFLNGNELSIYASTGKSSIRQVQEYITALKNEGSINAIDWNGGMSPEQLSWLEKQLNESTQKNEKAFIMCHFPVYPENIHNLLNYREVNAILEKYHNVIAWFNGHNHAGNYGNFNMIHFITLKGMVETENNSSFALVEVYHNKIWIKGSGRERGQILAY
jgi:manganese-dependent ADP-ribose/CDP-alcohol diphosphatase